MTKGTLFPLAALTIALSGPAPALASGDSCEATWSLDFAAKAPCANISAMVPGNDSRANLALLLADRRGGPGSSAPAPVPTPDWPAFRAYFSESNPDGSSGEYAEGEGSRCLSNDAGGKAFAAAIAAAQGLSPAERAALTQARAALAPACAPPAGPPMEPPPPPDVSSPLGKDFAEYLAAATAFYAGRFDDADRGFESLARSPDPWLSDTAAYMRARTAVNRMQADAFDQYGAFKGPSAVDKGLADRAGASLEAYLSAHPDGRYAASARGLLRRVDWLAGRTDRLTERYAALIAEPPARRGLSDAALADEIDNKLQPSLTPGSVRDPILLAVTDLMAMRKPDKGEEPAPRPDLAAQREAFAGMPDLYGFLEASLAYYVDHDAKAVTRLIPDDARRRGGDHLWFSRQFLRGTALEALGDRNARGFWKELLAATSRPLDRSVTQLALALDDERRGDPADALGPGSPVTNVAIRTLLLLHDAGPDLLRARAVAADAPPRERQVALFTLLRKEISHGEWAAFLSDVRLVPPGASKDGGVVAYPLDTAPIPLGLFTDGQTAGDIGCPALTATAAALARDPSAVRPRLCVGEWQRLNDVGTDPFWARPAKGALGSGPTSYPGKALTRDATYASVIADRGAAPEDRAFALYRAVKCYEPAGINGCGGPDVPKAQRQRWNAQLKSEYPGSRWARELRYWW